MLNRKFIGEFRQVKRMARKVERIINEEQRIRRESRYPQQLNLDTLRGDKVG